MGPQADGSRDVQRNRDGAGLLTRRNVLRAGAGAIAGAALGSVNVVPARASHLTIEKRTTTLITHNAQVPPLLNGKSFQQDGILSHNGWQYAAYYNQAGSVRNVALARRQIGTPHWEHLQLTDYAQTINDRHNVVAMGVSPADGRLHLAFDMHNSTLRYRQSVAGLVHNPGAFSWNQSLFGPVRNNLCGPTITGVTYPRFITSPGGNLIFVLRKGAAGNGDITNFRWTTGEWRCDTPATGVFISGAGQVNAYLNTPMMYDPNGRLHVTWVWRAPGGVASNHDLMYIYSDDNGITWRNNAGQHVGTTRTNPITPSTPGVRVWPIPQGSNLSNTSGQFAPGGGRVHVVLRENVSGSPRYIHYYRNGSGTWVRRDTGVPWSRRGKILTDPAGNAYILAGNLRILGATAASNFTDWHVIDTQSHGQYDLALEPLFDLYRLTKGDGYVSIYYQRTGSQNLDNLNYRFTT